LLPRQRKGTGFADAPVGDQVTPRRGDAGDELWDQGDVGVFGPSRGRGSSDSILSGVGKKDGRSGADVLGLVYEEGTGVSRPLEEKPCPSRWGRGGRTHEADLSEGMKIARGSANRYR